MIRTHGQDSSTEQSRKKMMSSSTQQAYRRPSPDQQEQQQSRTSQRDVVDTYREASAKLERSRPDPERMFCADKVEDLLKLVLDGYLHNVKYDPSNCSRLAQTMCSVIKAKTKEFNYDRYKLVVQVYVGQDSDQSVQLASRCIWDAKVDAYAAATYRNKSLYGIAIVYGLYLA